MLMMTYYDTERITAVCSGLIVVREMTAKVAAAQQLGGTTSRATNSSTMGGRMTGEGMARNEATLVTWSAVGQPEACQPVVMSEPAAV